MGINIILAGYICIHGHTVIITAYLSNLHLWSCTIMHSAQAYSVLSKTSWSIPSWLESTYTTHDWNQHTRRRHCCAQHTIIGTTISTWPSLSFIKFLDLTFRMGSMLRGADKYTPLPHKGNKRIQIKVGSDTDFNKKNSFDLAKLYLWWSKEIL